MTPRPDEKTVKQLKEDARRALQAYEDEVAAAEKKYALRLNDLKNSYHGALTDISDALGKTRDAIYKLIKRHTQKTPASK
ncbi:hypothetical protein [Streptomyces lutosisoli]|uniref:Uncharacterized protein n=1 Tax=Streptomyces lutosisoli TaxID=2665721 RepID=A0ABW2VY15_9ACTN